MSNDTAIPEADDGSYTTVGKPLCDDAKFAVRGVNVFYGEKQAVYDVNLDIAKNEVVAMIGPSGVNRRFCVA